MPQPLNQTQLVQKLRQDMNQQGAANRGKSGYVTLTLRLELKEFAFSFEKTAPRIEFANLGDLTTPIGSFVCRWLTRSSTGRV